MGDYQSIEAAARDALVELGLEPPKHFKVDKFQVVDATEGRPGNGAGRLKIFADGQGGFAQNWRTGDRRSFFLNAQGQTSGLSEAEKQRIEAARRKRQAEEQASLNRAAKRAVSIWQQAAPAPDNHPYLTAKQVKAHGARLGSWKRSVTDDQGQKQLVVIENSLLIPLFDRDGRVRSLQAIFPERHPVLLRNKDLLPGGGLAGLFWWIGPRSDTLIIAEGFATAATLHEQTGNRVYLAFTANNLLAVAQIVRDKLPNAEIILAADNDTETDGNPGLTKATEAAQAVGGSVIVPPVPDADFNDYQLMLNGGAYVG